MKKCKCVKCKCTSSRHVLEPSAMFVVATCGQGRACFTWLGPPSIPRHVWDRNCAGGGCLCTQFGLKNTYIEDGGSKYYRVFGLHTNAIYESGFVLSSACCFRKEFHVLGRDRYKSVSSVTEEEQVGFPLKFLWSDTGSVTEYGTCRIQVTVSRASHRECGG